jgi:RNA polymerase sigma-70 factor (ECF subfamily)
VTDSSSPPADSDRARQASLLEAAGRGDHSALEKLYAAHVDGLYAFVFYRVGRDASLCEDVVQETFLHALESHADYQKSRGSIRAWLCTLSRNVIRKQLRGHRRPSELAATWERIDATLAQIFQALDRGPLGDEVLAREETRDLVNMTIANLPDDYRIALEKKYVEGRSLTEMAAALAISEDAVKSRLARARRAFRETFETLATAFSKGQERSEASHA